MRRGPLTWGPSPVVGVNRRVVAWFPKGRALMDERGRRIFTPASYLPKGDRGDPGFKAACEAGRGGPQVSGPRRKLGLASPRNRL